MKRFYVSLLLVSSILITGCAGAFLAGAAAGGLVVYERRPIEIIHEDQNLRTSILEQLKADSDLKRYTRVEVASFNKTIVLIGQAPFPHLKSKAEQIARSVPDVKKLYNLVETGHPIGVSQQAEDTWITTKVKTQLLATPGVKSGMIKVVTENRVVYLLGKVTKRQAELAVEEVRRVAGVRKVIKIFDYNV